LSEKIAIISKKQTEMKVKLRRKVVKALKWCAEKLHIGFVVSAVGDHLLEKRIAKAYSQILRNGDVYYDIGANHGNRIAPVVKHIKGCKIVAVEPQAECVSFLKEKFGNKITVIPKGLGELEGEAPMVISNDDRLSSFATEWMDANKESGRFEFMGAIWDEKRMIQMTTLDRLIEEFGVPRFIKIDVEGYELEVLKGLSQPIEMISFEYTTPEYTAQCIECVKRISDISQNKILCNYSIGESMKWALPTWVSSEEMLTQILSTPAFGDGSGDIYIKYQPN
jgi:FkbM family methyltransferase